MRDKIDSSTEFEIAWLVKQMPSDLDKSPAVKIKQGYLPNNNPRIKDIRVREKNNKFTYTVKKFQKGSKETGYCSEETKNLTGKKFEKYWENAKKKTTKTRYFYSLKNGLLAEIDVYANNLSGLNVVEVEFPNVSVFKSFKKPSWFGKEVTDSKGIYPPVIAEMTIDEVKKMNDEYVQTTHNFD